MLCPPTFKSSFGLYKRRKKNVFMIALLRVKLRNKSELMSKISQNHWWPEFNSWNTHVGRRKLAHTSCPLTSCTPSCMCMHTHKTNIFTKCHGRMHKLGGCQWSYCLGGWSRRNEGGGQPGLHGKILAQTKTPWGNGGSVWIMGTVFVIWVLSPYNALASSVQCLDLSRQLGLTTTFSDQSDKALL